MDHGLAQKCRIRLTCEALESRLNPDAAGYINNLYQVVLHRIPSQTDVNFWTTQLQNDANSGLNVSPNAQVAAAFWLSPEHRGLQIDQYYQTFLNRTESAADRQFWVNTFTNGGLSEMQVQLAFVTSAEFQSLNAGATNYVQALYQDILGRAADTGGLNYWMGQFQSAGANSVALGILSSQEALMRDVSMDYLSLLGRPADTAGLTYWTSQLLGDGSDPGNLIGFNGTAANMGSNNGDNSQSLDNLALFTETLGNHDSSNDSLEEAAVDMLTSAEFQARSGNLLSTSTTATTGTTTGTTTTTTM